MDRRQKKTRDSIMDAFISLLSVKHYNQISVQEIIDRADVGRSTFYAHFETKDYLLRELCEELGDHLIETAHGHFSDEHRNTADSVFLHLLIHLQENNRNILDLLSSPNNAIFMRYFKDTLKDLILAQYKDSGLLDLAPIPRDYLVNHIAASFVETAYWWISHDMAESPQTVATYFAMTVPPFCMSGRALCSASVPPSSAASPSSALPS